MYESLHPSPSVLRRLNISEIPIVILCDIISSSWSQDLASLEAIEAVVEAVLGLESSKDSPRTPKPNRMTTSWVSQQTSFQ